MEEAGALALGPWAAPPASVSPSVKQQARPRCLGHQVLQLCTLYGGCPTTVACGNRDDEVGRQPLLDWHGCCVTLSPA